MANSLVPFTPALPKVELLLNWNYQRWLPHVDLKRRLAVHPFQQLFLAQIQRWKDGNLAIADIPEWLEYLTDDISEQMLLNILVYVYSRGQVRTWTRGLCVPALPR